MQVAGSSPLTGLAVRLDFTAPLSLRRSPPFNKHCEAFLDTSQQDPASVDIFRSKHCWRIARANGIWSAAHRRPRRGARTGSPGAFAGSGREKPIDERDASKSCACRQCCDLPYASQRRGGKSQRHLQALKLRLALAVSHQFWSRFQIALAECTSGLMGDCGIGANSWSGVCDKSIYAAQGRLFRSGSQMI